MADRDDAGDAPGALDGITHGWGRRAWSTGRVAASALRLAGRRLVGRSDGGVDGRIGEALVRELDQMKGLAMKVGQILSYFDGVLPPETHAALQALQVGRRGVRFEVVAERIEAELGAGPDTLFEGFERAPVAAASIGQVHRARFEGQPVAVKVQYPAVLETFEADFGRIGKLAKLASLATAVDGPALAEELRARVVEECDYRREARWQRRFAAVWAERLPDAVRVPAVIDARSGDTVLTTAWCKGVDFYRFVEQASAERRSAAGRVLARVALESFFTLGAINADPHPGNYLFEPGEGGRVELLDFGCIRRFDRGYVERERAVVRAVLAEDRAAFREAVLATGMVPRPDRFDFEQWYAMQDWQYRPYRAAGFRFDADYIREGARFNGTRDPNLRRVALPPPWIWWMRLVWGLHAVLARLGAEGDFAEVMRGALDGAWCPTQG